MALALSSHDLYFQSDPSVLQSTSMLVLIGGYGLVVGVSTSISSCAVLLPMALKFGVWECDISSCCICTFGELVAAVTF